MKNQRGIQGVRRLLVSQAAITVFIALIAAFAFGYAAFISALLGGLVSIIPNAYFARKLFRYHGARAAKKIVNSFYKGEALKILLSIILFMAVFILVDILPIVFFTTYILVQMVLWFAPLIFEK